MQNAFVARNRLDPFGRAIHWHVRSRWIYDAHFKDGRFFEMTQSLR